MEQTRLILIIGLSFVALLLWEAWQRDYAPIARDAAIATSPSSIATPTDSPPAIEAPTDPKQSLTNDREKTAPIISLRSDVLNLQIRSTGAVITKAQLLTYPIGDPPNTSPFSLLDESDSRFFIYQGGLKADGESPDHQAVFEATEKNIELAPNTASVTAELHWQSTTGVLVTKQITLHRGSYAIEIRYTVENNSATPWIFNHYEQLQRKKDAEKRRLINTFTGVALSSPTQRYQKHTFDKLRDEPINQDITNGWTAILEHYFVSAVIPNAALPYHYYSSLIGADHYVVGYYSPKMTVAPKTKQVVVSTVFLGPKLQELLPKIAPGLEHTVDYGVLWPIGNVLFWIMAKLHVLIGNWGWSIILLTCIVKGVFFPLSAAGYRSMAKMRKVQPRLLAIRDRYSNDRPRLNQAMMELYKEEKINPLGGCLPIVVQIPVFIALYWVILESVELRDAPWTLWIKDLSNKDPYFVLPVLMTLSMWLQSKLNPAPMDPIQARVMQIMPFAFGVFFAFFPAGLVLYWFVNNVLSITQQWFITRAMI